MTTPTLLLSPSGSRDRSGAIAPTISGAVRQVPGQFGSAWLVEEGTTNLFEEASAVGSTSRWGALSSATKQVLPSTHPDYPSLNMIRVTTPGSIGGEGMRVYTPQASHGNTTTARTFVASFWFRGMAGRAYGAQNFILYDSGSGLDQSSVVTWTATGAWQRIVLPALTAKTTNVLYQLMADVGRTTGVRTDTFDVVAPQIEEKGYATTPAVGSLGTGYSWLGAAHNSRSQRVGGRVSYKPPAGWQTITGSMVVRAKRPVMTAVQGSPRVFSWAGYGNADDHLDLVLQLSGSAQVGATTAGANSLSGGAFLGGHQGDTWYTFYTEWTASGMSVTTELGTASRNRAAPDGRTAPDPSFIDVGSDQGAAQHVNGLIESAMMFDRPLTAQQRATLFDHPATWTWDLLIPRVYQITPIGRAAGAEWSVRYLLVDALNTPIDDVTRSISPGGVDLDPDKAVSGQLTVGIDRPFRLPPYASFLAPIVTIRSLDGRPEQTEQQGLYRMRRGPLDWVDDRDRGIVASGRFTLDDLTGSVRDAKLGDVYNVAAGVKYTDAAKLILQEVSLPGGALLRVRFPDDPRTLPAPMTWVANDSRLKVAGDLLARIGCYTPLADGIGTLTSIYYRDFDRGSPDRVYTAGDDSEIIDRPRTDTDDSTLANQITVIQEDQDPAKRYRTVVEVTDPRSPIHRNRIGLRPRLEMVSQYADQAAVTAYAMRLAATWGSVAESITLQTHLDLSHDPYGLFALDLSGASRPGDDREWIDGRWRVGGVRHDHAAGRTTVNGSRTQPFVLTAAGVAS